MREEFRIWLRRHQWRAATAVVGGLLVLLTLAEVVPRYSRLHAQFRDWQRKRAELVEVHAWEAQKAIVDEKQWRLERRFDELSVSLPENTQMSVILSLWQRNAEEVEVSLRQVRPGERVRHGSYDELPFDVALRGTFHGIGRFADLLERSRYVMKINGLTIDRGGSTSEVLQAEMALSVILFDEQ